MNECTRVYADEAHSVIKDDTTELIMDQAETEEAAGGPPEELKSLSRAGAIGGTLVHPPTTSFASESPAVKAVAQPANSKSAHRLPRREHDPKDDGGSQAALEVIEEVKNEEDINDDMQLWTALQSKLWNHQHRRRAVNRRAFRPRCKIDGGFRWPRGAITTTDLKPHRQSPNLRFGPWTRTCQCSCVSVADPINSELEPESAAQDTARSLRREAGATAARRSAPIGECGQPLNLGHVVVSAVNTEVARDHARDIKPLDVLAFVFAPTVHASRLSQLWQYANPRSLAHAVLHAFLGGVAVRALLGLSQGRYSELVVGCGGAERHRCLNEGHTFLILHGVFTGVLLHLRRLSGRQHCLSFPVIQLKFANARSQVNLVFRKAVLDCLKSCYVFYGLYYLL
ncbi:hypothetical protein HPB47_009500, partial [Ixodes persulcatus]